MQSPLRIRTKRRTLATIVLVPAGGPYVDLTATDLTMPEASNPGGQDLADACVGCVAPFPNSRLAGWTWSEQVPWFTGPGGGLQRGSGEGALLGIAWGVSRGGGGVVDPVHDQHPSDHGNRGDDSHSDSTQTSVEHGQSTPPSNPPNDPGPNPPPDEPPQPPGDGPRAPQAVPEPATLLLTALGAGGLIARRMRARS